RLSSAGHTPPVLAIPGRQAAITELEIDVPVGVDTALPRSSTLLAMPPGAVLLFYTDGLIERRDESVDVGLERLRAMVTPDHPRLVCHRVMNRLVGTTQQTDDIAVLAVRRTATP